MIKHKKKNLKPINYSVNFIYSCPSCSLEHWLSLKETQTKGFKVVCDCGVVFRVRLIKDIKILYDTKKPKPQPTSTVIKQEFPKEAEIKEIKVEQPKPKIESNLLNKCSSILINYGFTKEESDNLIISAFEKNPMNNCTELVKYTISNIGDLKNG